MIRTERAEQNEIAIDRGEVFRYLGLRGAAPDAATAALVEKCIAEIQPHLSLIACSDTFRIGKNTDGSLSLGFADVRSKSLEKALGGCGEIILFAATIGHETDRIIQKYSAVSPSSAVVSQAIGAAAIEEWCNCLCRRFAARAKARGLYLRPRFSPGYGDLPLELQRKILPVLDCGRRIGVTLTESLLMMPSKSVSAIVGLSGNDTGCARNGCEECGNIECNFRRS